MHFPNTPTYFPPQVNRTTPSTIDVILTNGYNGISDVITINDLSSDHLPVRFKLEFFSTYKAPPSSQRCYDKADWSLYRDHVNSNIDLLSASKIDTIIKIDDAIMQLAVLIKIAEDIAIPFFEHRKHQPSIDSITKDLISLRNCRRRQWQRSGTPSLKKEVNFLNREIKSRIKSLNNDRWNTKLAQVKNHSSQLWKVTKILSNPTKKIPPIKSDSKILTTDTDKANEIGSAFCKAQSTTYNDLSDRSINFFSPTIAESSLPKPREISRLIRVFKNRRSPGDDSIKNTLLKQLPKKATIMLMYIFRACFRLSYFPNAWK